MASVFELIPEAYLTPQNILATPKLLSSWSLKTLSFYFGMIIVDKL